jgi:hypothetical protein
LILFLTYWLAFTRKKSRNNKKTEQIKLEFAKKYGKIYFESFNEEKR